MFNYPHYGLCSDCDSITDLNSRLVCKLCQDRHSECETKQIEILRRARDHAVLKKQEEILRLGLKKKPQQMLGLPL